MKREHILCRLLQVERVTNGISRRLRSCSQFCAISTNTIGQSCYVEIQQLVRNSNVNSPKSFTANLTCASMSWIAAWSAYEMHLWIWWSCRLIACWGSVKLWWYSLLELRWIDSCKAIIAKCTFVEKGITTSQSTMSASSNALHSKVPYDAGVQ